MIYTPANTPPCRVYVNGIEVEHVTRACIIDGWVEHYVRSSDGQYHRDPRSPEQLYTQFSFGVVTIVPLDPTATLPTEPPSPKPYLSGASS